MMFSPNKSSERRVEPTQRQMNECDRSERSRITEMHGTT
jgi:hypothetical protein